jgi:hypothetical protein
MMAQGRVEELQTIRYSLVTDVIVTEVAVVDVVVLVAMIIEKSIFYIENPDESSLCTHLFLPIL